MVKFTLSPNFVVWLFTLVFMTVSYAVLNIVIVTIRTIVWLIDRKRAKKIKFVKVTGDKDANGKPFPEYAKKGLCIMGPIHGDKVQVFVPVAWANIKDLKVEPRKGAKHGRN